MRVVVAGSRLMTDVMEVESILAWHIGMLDYTPEFCSGGAKGVDTIAEVYLDRIGADFIRFEADWNQGKAAGYKRNKKMIEWALEDEHNMLIAILKGDSYGTRHTIRIAIENHIRVMHVYRPNKVS
jgi:hypothetical protein